jgi:hypothetical protein
MGCDWGVGRAGEEGVDPCGVASRVGGVKGCCVCWRPRAGWGRSTGRDGISGEVVARSVSDQHAIRARPDSRSTAIEAITASAFNNARDAILEAGAEGWRRKPCREAELLEALLRIRAAPPRPCGPARGWIWLQPPS